MKKEFTCPYCEEEFELLWDKIPLYLANCPKCGRIITYERKYGWRGLVDVSAVKPFKGRDLSKYNIPG
jgi:transcription elongation factor Elf1